MPEFVRAPLSCESIVCLVFMRLLLSMGLSGIAMCSATCLIFCGVGESLGLYSLHLFLLWAGYCFGVGLFFFQFVPYLFSPLVRGLTSTPAMPLHCSCHDIV